MTRTAPLAALACIALLTACSSDVKGAGTGASAATTASPDPGTASASSLPASPEPSTSASSTSTTNPASPSASHAASASGSPDAELTGVPRCTSTNANWTIDANDAGTDSVHYVLQVTPRSRPCRVQGYAGVSLVWLNSGTQLGAAADRVRPTHAAVTIPVGEFASADVTLVQASSTTGCTARSARGWRIIPPDTRSALYLPMKGLRGCKQPSIHLLSVGAFDGPMA